MLLRGRQKTSCFLRPAVCAEVSFVHLLQCLLRGGAKPARSGQREQGRNSRSPGAERTGRPGQKRSLGRSIERCKNKDAGIPKGWPLGRSFVHFWRPRNGPQRSAPPHAEGNRQKSGPPEGATTGHRVRIFPCSCLVSSAARRIFRASGRRNGTTQVESTVPRAMAPLVLV